MKPDESFPEIDRLLKSSQPHDPAPAGLEARILQALDAHRSPQPTRRWGLLLPILPVAAVVILLAVFRPAPSAPQVSPQAAVSAPPTVAVEITELVRRDPLQAESVALVRDAHRVGDFLRELMPGL